jgi:hypothetical protein
MENFELINDFIDGELSSAEEEELFAKLSQNDEMRSELKQQMAFKTAVKGDIKAFTPKAESTMKIFSTLGFAAAAASSPTILTRLRDFYVGNSSAILTGVASVVATSIVFLLLWKNGIMFSGDELGEGVSKEEIVVNYDIPVVESYVPMHEFDSYKINEKASVKIVYRDVYISDKDQENISQSKSDRAGSALLTSDPNVFYSKDHKFQRGNANYYSNRSFNSNDHNYIIDSPGYYSENEFLDKFSVEFSGSQYFNDIQGNFSSGRETILNNTDLAFLYDLNSQLQFGFTYTRENFYLQYSGFNAGNLYEYEQNPNLNTFGATLRYSPNLLKFGIFEPFANLSFGANNIGPVLRGGVGAKANLGYGSYLIFGFNRNVMWYEHQNATNYSGKNGFYGGIGLRFK